MDRGPRDHAAATTLGGAADVRREIDLDRSGDISRYELYCGVAKMVPPELWREDLATHLYR